MPLKAELHCHIEGAAAPELVVSQARKYGKDTSPFIQDGSFVWHDFTSFLAAYDFSPTCSAPKRTMPGSPTTI